MMPNPIPDETITALRSLLFSGRKIEAIKLYREVTGIGLKEAKDAVEELEAFLRKDAPEKFAAPPAGKGCFGAAAAFCLCVGATIYWLTRT